MFYKIIYERLQTDAEAASLRQGAIALISGGICPAVYYIG